MTRLLTLTFMVVAYTLRSQPAIVSHPQGQADIAGTTIRLDVGAAGSGSLHYQWRFNENLLTNQTSSSLTITGFSSLREGAYDVIVTNNSGSVTSDVATLSLDLGYTFTTLAGLHTNYGHFDGVGNGARFGAGIRGLAVDGAGNVYVADAGNQTVRKITPEGTVTTLAGLAGHGGSADGNGSAARFNLPNAIAVDTNGNVYVAEYLNKTIRKITPTGMVNTLAGKAGESGTADGAGPDARFTGPNGLALDAEGNLFVTEWSAVGVARPIRKISPKGLVSTLTNSFSPAARMAGVAVDAGNNLFVVEERGAIWRGAANGSAGIFAGTLASSGAVDGFASNARFNSPWGLAVDAAGSLFVCDRASRTIRAITADGIVSTLAGLAGAARASEDGTGGDARFDTPWGVAVDGDGMLYVSDQNGTIRKGARFTGAPIIVVQPLSQAVAPGSSATFSITVTSAAPVSCQWRFQGADLPGETNLTLTVTNVQTTQAGYYQAVATNALGRDASVLASLGLLGQPVWFVAGETQSADDGLRLRLTGLLGQGRIVVQASTNLIFWEPIYTNFAGFVDILFTDPGATNTPHRFYRAAIPSVP